MVFGRDRGMPDRSKCAHSSRSFRQKSSLKTGNAKTPAGRWRITSAHSRVTVAFASRAESASARVHALASSLNLASRCASGFRVNTSGCNARYRALTNARRLRASAKCVSRRRRSARSSARISAMSSSESPSSASAYADSNASLVPSKETCMRSRLTKKLSVRRHAHCNEGSASVQT